MSMPDPIKIGRWGWSYPSIRIAEAVNELIGVVRRHLKDGHDDGDDSEAIKKLTKGLSDLNAKHDKLRAEFEKLRDLDQPRIVTKLGKPQDKDI